MIQAAGVTYGTARDIARALGPDITPAMVRRWAQRHGLTSTRVGRRVLYPLGDAARIERDVRRSGRGRARRLDIGAVAA